MRLPRKVGDKAAALSLSERGMTVNPTEKDAVVGPASIEFFARVAAQTGEADRAIAALQKLLSTSYSGPLGPGAPLTPALLRLRSEEHTSELQSRVDLVCRLL